MSPVRQELKVLIESDQEAKGSRIVLFVRPIGGGDDWSVTVPLGEPFTLDVRFGQCLLEALLPSGERLRKVVEVPHASLVILRPSRSPHQGLGLQHLLVAPRPAKARMVLESFVLPSEPSVYVLPKWPASWKGAGLNEQALSRTPFRVDPKNRLAPKVHDQVFYRFDIAPTTPVAEGHRAVLVALNDRVSVVPVADAWDGQSDSNKTAELVVNTASQSISTTITDREFAPVLAYLSNGRADLAAAALGELSMGALLRKRRNPYAAAAGAYVLIDQLHDLAHPPEWRDWISNLSRWFPWLPDGALLEGRALQHTDRPLEALEQFLEAFDRGVPFFAEGVRVLLQGLLSFSEGDVSAAKAARLATATRAVRQWASWLDPRESFTTLTLPITLKEEPGAKSLAANP